jgi:eukaryotic-like serine/threonine-protein kinase
MIDAVHHHANPETTSHAERAMLERSVREYQVVRELGRGAMGVVFLARDVALHRLVAIKVLRQDLAGCEEQRERFRREARVTARLTDGVVAVHGFGERDELVYIVMEFVRGVPLSTRLHDAGTLAVDDARGILLALARTLDQAHARGIVHRDLKPENVLLDADSGRALLTDFGVALTRSVDPLPSETSEHTFGTPHFMSPEQAAGDTDVDGRERHLLPGRARVPDADRRPPLRGRQLRRDPGAPNHGYADAAPGAPAGRA